MLIGCSKRHEMKNSLKVNIKEAANKNLFSLIDSIFLIEIDTINNFVVGEISSVSISDRVLISDKNSNLFIFDIEGKPLHKISNKGNAPGEYVNIDDIYYSNKEIFLLDIMQNKIIKYSHEGVFLEEFKSPVKDNIGGFSFLEKDNKYIFEKDIYFISEDLNYNIYMYDNENDSINYFLPFEKTISVVLSPRKKFFSLNDTLIYVPTYRNRVYNILSNRVEERLSFDFLNNWIDEEYFYNPVNETDPMKFVYGLQEKNNIYFLNYFETNTHYYMDFYCGDKQYFYIKNKSNENEYLIKSKDINGFEIKSKCLGIYDNYFIFSINQSELKEILHSIKYEFSNKQDVKYEFSDLDDDKNELLMLVKFK